MKKIYSILLAVYIIISSCFSVCNAQDNTLSSLSYFVSDETIGVDSFDFDISFSDTLPNSDVNAIIAFYDEDNSLLSFKSTSVDVSSESKHITIPVSVGSYDTYRLFVWDSLHSIVPIKKQNQEKENFEILSPYADGFISKPIEYYTAYYDVDYNIDKLFVEFNNSGTWSEVDMDNYYKDDTFTDNACMIAIPYELLGTTPSVKLKAYYNKKVQKIEGTPTFTLDGYRIKAELNGETEYFTPWATVPTALVSASKIVKITDYLKFERVNPVGDTETFYLALRPKSNSKFSVNGMSPTNLSKVMAVSQDINKQYYRRIYPYYTRFNSHTNITFYDETDPTVQNYDEWRKILKNTVDTFNSCLSAEGINAHITEVNRGETENSVIYGSVPDDYAGLCQMYTGYFIAWISNDRFMLSTNREIKSTAVHELGHLLGFNDSAYAIDDSLYSYARDKNAVTYFQPNDIATLISWLKHGA